MQKKQALGTYRGPRISVQVGILMLTTMLAYCVLYGPQPLLPLFARSFAITDAQAALLVTATLFPLSLAPLSYGSLLESFAAHTMLRLSVLALALSVLAFTLVDSFPLLVGIRFVQGLVLPATLTATMTYIARVTHGRTMRQTMAAYVAATILGGFLGRLLAGFTATYFDWHMFFYSLAAALMLCWVALGALHQEAIINTTQRSFGTWRAILQRRDYVLVYLAVFCLFFVFAGLLNFLPFRVGELQAQSSALLTSLMYTGYVLGVATALGANRLVAALRGDALAMITGFVVYIGALLVTMVGSLGTLFGALWVFCGAMFFVHTVAAGLVNQRAAYHKGMVNGLYVAFYYGGGVVGSSAPGFIYERYGWTAFVLVLTMVAGVGLVCALCAKTSLNQSSPEAYAAPGRGGALDT